MHSLKKISVLTFIVITFICAASLRLAAQIQEFDFVSPTPNYFKWKQLTNDTIRIVYPPIWENKAKDIGKTILWQAKNHPYALGNKVRKLTVVLHAENAQSNGYVALAPYRSEYYLTPMHQSNELGSLDFGKLLSLHEYRHALQVANSLKGFSKFLYYLSGERGWAIYHNLAVPNWFFEGDAVLTETAFTLQGRGRLPSFLNDYRFLALSNSKYSYQKARNGSLKDFVPDHYTLGYLLCRNGLDEYGSKFWPQVFENTNKGNLLFFSFKRNFKKLSGTSLNNFYNYTIEKYYNNWLKDTIISENTFARVITKQNKTFTSYSYPRFVSDTQLIVLKKAFNMVPTFTLLSLQGQEQKIVEAGFSTDSYFDYSAGFIVYTEVSFDKRYSNLNYSDIVLINTQTKIKKKITYRTKTFAPSFNNDATKIIAIELTSSLVPQLVLYDRNGVRLKSYSYNNYYYTFPRFLNDNEVVSAVRDSLGKMAIVKINLTTGEHSNLTSFTNNILTDLFAQGQNVYFTASFNGKDQLYVLNSATGLMHKILSRINYTYMPCVNLNAENIVFTELTNKGRQVLIAELNNTNYEEISVLELHQLFAFKSKNFDSIKTSVQDVTGQFNVSNYNPKRYLFNVHSWEPSLSRAKLGVKLFSDDILSTTRIEAGAYYNFIERKPLYTINAMFAAWYPVFKLSSEIIPLRYMSVPINNVFTDSIPISEKKSSLFTYVPINLTQGLYQKKLNIGVGFNYSSINGIKDPIFNKKIFMYHVSANYLAAFRKAYQHSLSRKAIYFQADYYTSVNGWFNQLATFTEFALPGINNNDVCLFNVGYLKQNIQSGYTLFSEFNLSRGYNSLGLNEFIRTQYNYHFTLTYPDKGINGIIYFYRIRLNPFIDLGWAKAYTSQRFYQVNTAGTEVIADVNIFNTLPAKFGIRFNLKLNSYFNNQTIFTPIQFFVPVYFF